MDTATMGDEEAVLAKDSSGTVKAGGDHRKSVHQQQTLRIRRFCVAMATYAMAILGGLLIEWLGLAHMSLQQWAWVIGLALIGNGVFLLMFITGVNLRYSDQALIWVQIIYSGLWGGMLLLFLPEMRAVLLLFYIPAFSFGMLGLSRKNFLLMTPVILGAYGIVLVLDYLKRPHTFDPTQELLAFFIFGAVLTWFAVFGGFISNMRQRLREQNAAIRKANLEIQLEIEERRQTQLENDKLIVELRQALSKVKVFSGLLPICAACKKIRDDKGEWNQLEHYIAGRSEARFSHSICPECARELYSDVPGFKSQTKSGPPTGS
jgi:hypothetical protein